MGRERNFASNSLPILPSALRLPCVTKESGSTDLVEGTAGSLLNYWFIQHIVTLTSAANSKWNSQYHGHDEVHGKTLNKGGNKMDKHCDEKSHSSFISVGHPTKEVCPKQLASVEYGFRKGNVLFGILAQNVPLKRDKNVHINEIC